ncbi:IclR family transcriptional regulator [Paraburkholderia ferrariae]|uniref:IclR family transcriptional regulator n=1 Tax=Paraburkholderia ferrariae TaxID=386056 RepID=UPI0004835940|nr:helix-turn-helix domain-containing protein [Paraburkholderia ferrariae]
MTPTADKPGKVGVAAVDRALSVLSALADGKGNLSLSELAEGTGLYKSTLLRLLTSLTHARLVARQPDGCYVLGPTVAKLHAAYMRSFSCSDWTVAALHELVKTTRESAAFFVQRGEFQLCLYRVASPHPVRDTIETGRLLPSGIGAAGRVLDAYAHIGDEASGQRIRQAQVLLLKGDRDAELAEIAAPVFGALGDVLGAIALIIPSERVQSAWTVRVREAAEALSLQMGGGFPDQSTDHGSVGVTAG